MRTVVAILARTSHRAPGIRSVINRSAVQAWVATGVLLASFTVARAAWVPDGIPLSTAANHQQYPTVVADGTGGAIVVWRDYRSGTAYDIYVQRVDDSGTSQWTADGVALCVAANNQDWPTIVPDGAGGAIVAWQDARPYPFIDIYVQRVNASGVPQWTANGVALCTAGYDQRDPVITPDGAGGAIVAWRDYRSGTNYDLYAQRVNDAGAPQWTANGIALCTATDDQFTTTPTSTPSIVSDDAGGAIVTWFDYRANHLNADIYAQRVNASGAIQWTPDGVALCADDGDQVYPAIVRDDAGGAIVTWWDSRNGTTDVYAQRVNASGTAQWIDQGVAVCTASSNQFATSMIADGAGGAIVAWRDYREGASNTDVYAQRVNASGAPQWINDGVAVCVSANNQINPMLVSDESGGAIVTWYDIRSGTNDDIYAQRVDAAGDPLWAANGVAVCVAANHQFSPNIVADGSGGAIVAWYDRRSGTHDDIYAQHLNAAGSAITTPVSTPALPLLVGQVYPNPFATTASLDIGLPASSSVAIEVFDVTGRVVRAIKVEGSQAGWSSVSFDGRDERGRLLASGVYFCRVHAGGTSVTRKMVIAR